MTSPYTFFGFNVLNSRTREPATVGVIISGQKMLNRTLVAAMSKSYGVAGVQISKHPLGTVYMLAKVPTPDQYMVEVTKTAVNTPAGQYGGSGIPKSN